MWPATAAAGDAPSALSVTVSGVRQGGATEALSTVLVCGVGGGGGLVCSCPCSW